MKLRYLSLMFGVATLSACATKPEPVAQAPEPVVKAPAPVTRPAPTPPPQVVQQAPQPQVIMADPNAPIPGSVADFAYQAGADRIYFDYNQYDLSSEARNVLKNQAAWLTQYSQVTAVVAGHADERGTREYNLALGARRADSVKAFLVSQGVNPSRLTTVSYGKERPVDGRSNEAGWALNRNGHTNIVSGAIG